jgi:hypothetical protein
MPSLGAACTRSARGRLRVAPLFDRLRGKKVKGYPLPARQVLEASASALEPMAYRERQASTGQQTAVFDESRE